MSVTITLSAKNATLFAKFSPPITLERDSEICLLSLVFWNSIPNVDGSNNKFYYSKGKDTFIIEIPHGCYEIEDLESFLRTFLIKKHKTPALTDDQKLAFSGNYPISLIGNNQTLKSEMICIYKVDFQRENNIGSLLGFKKEIVEPFVKVVSSDLVKIMKTEIINVECNLSGASFENDKPSHSVYHFSPSVAPGYKIIEAPKNLIYHRLNTRVISEIEVKLTDQDGNLINLRGEQVHARLHIKPLV